MRPVVSLRNSSTVELIARRWSVTQPAVTAFIAALIPNFHDTQDVVQEVAAAVFAYDYDKKGWPDSFQAWCIGIARHKVFNFLRRRGGEMVFDSDAVTEILNAHAELADHFDARCEALEHCLKRVPSEMRELLELRYGGDLSHPEIAARTGLGVSNVKVGLHRIRMALRLCIERRLGRGTCA